MTDHNLRLSQIISPFGVGGICVLSGESFVGVDIGRWPLTGQRIQGMEHFSHALGIDHFKIPPVKSIDYYDDTSPKIPYHRFPRWLFCMSCRRLIYWRFQDDKDNASPFCNFCPGSRLLTPMRFIQICQNGHMGDVYWNRWAHADPKNFDQQGCQDWSGLRFESRRGTGGGLESLIIRCDSCKAQQSLSMLTASGSMERIGITCSGTQPWENAPSGHNRCTEPIQVVQSGASNVYFSHVPSAIDIPPGADFSHYSDITNTIKNDEEFELLKEIYLSGQGFAQAMISSMARRIGCTEKDMISALESSNDEEAAQFSPGSNTSNGMVEPDLLKGEWTAFISPRHDQDERDNFLTKHLKPPSRMSLSALDQRITRVVQATKIRVVKTLAGFSRYERNFEAPQYVPTDLGRGLTWLPATEVFGEGIFLSFDVGMLRQWESTSEIKNRAQRLISRRDSSFRAAWLPSPSPRFLMLHTFSHLLLRQLCFECGYSSSALRERIYCSDSRNGSDMAGILIYTSDGDSEGTLGGLVRQAMPENLERLVVNTLDKATWCSNDPVCSETSGQGVDALNLAACHACALAPETSCCYGNSLLDRSTVLGNITGVAGFLDDVLEESIANFI